MYQPSWSHNVQEVSDGVGDGGNIANAMVMCFNRRITHCSFILHLKDANTPDMLKDLERVAWLTMNYEYKISIMITELTIATPDSLFFKDQGAECSQKIPATWKCIQVWC